MSVGRVIGYLVVFLMVPVLIVALNVGFVEAQKCCDCDGDLHYKDSKKCSGIGPFDPDDADPCNPNPESPACPSCTPTEDPERSCSDGEDNDCDGLTDTEDPDCQAAGDPQCLHSYSANLGFKAGDAFESDIEAVYYDGVDQVTVISGDQGFRFDTYKPKLRPGKDPIRTVWLDLGEFDNFGSCPEGGAPCVPFGWIEGQRQGYITTDTRIEHWFGGLNLCSLCDPLSEECAVMEDTCYAGPAGDCALLGKDPTLQSQAKVGLRVGFTSSGVMSLHYGRKGPAENPIECDEPVVVTRNSATEWTIEGTRGCLTDDDGFRFVDQNPLEGDQGDYSRDAPFKMTIQQLD